MIAADILFFHSFSLAFILHFLNAEFSAIGYFAVVTILSPSAPFLFHQFRPASVVLGWLH